MGKNHLARLAVPKTWPVERKESKWVARPMPGPHPLERSIPLIVLIKDVLKHAKTTKEVRLILYQNNVLIDKKIRKEYKFPIGFMDVIEIPSLGESYRLIYNTKGVFSVVPIDKSQTNLKLLKIIAKSVVKKGLIQVTFHDGRNILVKKFDGKVGDSVLFDFSNKSVIKILHLDKGYLVYLSGGKHIGQLAKVKEVIKTNDLQKPRVIIEVDGKEYITFVKHVFVVGKDKLELDLGVKK